MKIDHLKIRHLQDYSYITIVVSFDLNEEQNSFDMWKAESEDFRRVRVMDSVEAYEKYYESSSIEFEETPDENGWYAGQIVSTSLEKPEPKYTSQEPLVEFLPKFNKFVYREIIERNIITAGAMRFLANTEKFESSELGSNLLLKTLKTLNLFWY